MRDAYLLGEADYQTRWYLCMIVFLIAVLLVIITSIYVKTSKRKDGKGFLENIDMDETPKN